MGGVTIDDLLRRHAVVAVDTMVFIYYLEDSRPWSDLIQPLFEAWEAGTHQGVTSVLTVLELTVQPLRMQRPEAARAYRDRLASFPGLVLVPLDLPVAQEAARLRATHGLSTPDAIQVASALVAGAPVLLTNDRRLARVPDLEVVMLDSLLAV